MQGIKILHFQNKCIGCNSCVLAAPYTWCINDETGKAELIDGIKKGNVTVAPLPESELENNKKASEACPMRIIKINTQ